MMLLLLAACGGPDEGSAGVDAAAYAGGPGRLVEFADPADEAHVSQLTLVITETTWEFTNLSGATLSVPWTMEGGALLVDGQVLLPAKVQGGSSAQGATVTSVGAEEVYYGTFPDAAAVTVEGGDFAGEHAFARDVGPIRLTWSGVWELAYYE